MFALLPAEDECVFYFEGRAGGGARQPAAGWRVSVQPGVQPSAAAAGQGHSSQVLRPHERPAGEAASSPPPPTPGPSILEEMSFSIRAPVWCRLQDLVSSHLLVAALPNRCCLYAHGIFSAFLMHFFFWILLNVTQFCFIFSSSPLYIPAYYICFYSGCCSCCPGGPCATSTSTSRSWRPALPSFSL